MLHSTVSDERWVGRVRSDYRREGASSIDEGIRWLGKPISLPTGIRTNPWDHIADSMLDLNVAICLVKLIPSAGTCDCDGL